MIFFRKIVPYWVYFGQDEDFKLTTELSEESAIFPQQGNQKRLKVTVDLQSVSENALFTQLYALL